MKISTQNLTDNYLDRKARSMFWAGRGWLREDKGYNTVAHWEWAFGKYASTFALSVSLGYGESNRGICLHACLPWVFSIFLVWERGPRVKFESETGIAIHSGSIWFHPFADRNEWNREFPWWKKTYSWSFPWTLDWWKTEMLSLDMKEVLWSEQKGDRKKGSRADPFVGMKARDEAKLRSSESHPYVYRLQSGEEQCVTATIGVDRMEWRARWWPLIWRKRVVTSIWVEFSSEVGEGSGSWKGGCTGCGYELKPGETALECLRRMERERKFKR